ncbi:hypothetical protein [Natronococcus occultus]|uniref:Uncharacterized protein n=1 Tax=Natronococcus occultus SP4 TaxID=694430 RepID=L0K0C2_9EURY|nr:hypothetical protein [Natronococcus occultus]AGB38747.1 hypothetical protein Natoc_2992 [Natronococcus occultus SP4]
MSEAVLDLTDDDHQQSLNNRSGFEFETTEAINGLECRLSAWTTGALTAYLTDGSGNIIERQSIATLDPGETFTFETALEADETYWVLCDARGREYVRGRAAVDYPIESSSLVATTGVFAGDGATTGSYRYCIDRISPAFGGETLDLGSDEEGQSWSSLDEPSGVRVQATTDLAAFECRLSAATSGVTEAYLTDDSGEVIDQQSIAGLGSGATFSFDTGLVADETYWILCDADGDSYVRGRTGVDYPLESNSLIATHGIYSGDMQSGSYRYCIDQILIPDVSEPTGQALDLGADDEGQTWASLDDWAGVRVQVTEAIHGLECRLSTETEDVTTAYLTTDNGDVLERQTVETLDGGETFAFESSLDPGEAYRIVFDARGRSYVRGRAAADYPIEGAALEVTHGIYGGNLLTESYRYCLDRIVPQQTSVVTPDAPDMTDLLDLGPDDEAQSGFTSWSGVRVELTDPVHGIQCRLSDETDVTTAYLTDDSGNVLSQQSVADLDSGETFVFDDVLADGEAYWVLCDSDGESYTRGRAEVEYPIESDSFVATHGIYTGESLSDSYRYCVDQIETLQGRDDVDTLSLGSDEEAQSGFTSWSGVRVEITEAAHGLQCRLSADTDVTTAYLTDDAGNVLSQQSVADLDPGETFMFDTGLGVGEAYWILCDGGSDSYTRGRTAVDYPIESDHLSATHGIYTGESFSDDYRYCIDQIQTVQASASVDTLGLGSDEEAQSGFTDWSGVRIQATEAVRSLQCRLSGETDVTTAYLTDDSGNVLRQQSLENHNPGDTFVFDVALGAGEVCWVLCDGDGDSYTRGRAAADYPLESEFLSVTHGVYTGTSLSNNYRYCIDQIQTNLAGGGLTSSLENRSLDVTTVDVVDEPAINENGDLAAELLTYLNAQPEVNHEFVLPAGTYDWNTEFVLYEPIEYLEIRGDPRATLQIRNHDVDIAFELGLWGDDNPPQHVVLQDLDVDIADEPERDAGLITAHVGRCLIDNVELVGQRWRHGPQGGGRYTCLINTRDPAMLSLVRNLSFPDGEIADSSEPSVGHSIGFSADPPHEGINVWQQCYVEDYVDNGFYVSNSVGENLIVHGTAVNCGNGTLRLGAADEARDCKVLLDAASEQIYPGAGLWLQGGEPLAERIEVDGSDAQNDIVRINSDADGGYITDLDVFCGPTVDAPAIRCTYTSDTDPSGVLIEDFTVEDVTTANDNASVRVRRPDIALSSGVINAAYRPTLGGAYDPDLEDVDLL